MADQYKQRARQEEDELRTRREAADFLRLKPQTLAKWAVDGSHLSYIKVGRSVRYRLSELQAFIERQTVGASS